MTDALNLALVVLVLGLGVWTIVARETFAAVAGFIVYGLAADARLGATVGDRRGADRSGHRRRADWRVADRRRVRGCAKTEAAARAERPGAADARAGRGRRPSAWRRRSPSASSRCPIRRPRSRPTSRANIAPTGVGNPITAVLMAFRAMDTLLEAIVLLLALIGVWSLAPDRGVGRPSGTAAPRRSQRHPRLRRARAAADRDCRRHLLPLGRAPTSRAASSRAPRCWRRCGCSS